VLDARTGRPNAALTKSGAQRRPPPSTCTLIAKFHYTDTDTDPNGPARTQRSFAAKKIRVRVRVVEFSSYPTTCADFVRVGPVSVSVSV